MLNGLDDYILSLLHIDEVRSNKLIDIKANNGKNSYFIYPNEENESFSSSLLNTIKSRIGKIGNTVLLDSSLTNHKEQIVGSFNAFNWNGCNDNKDVVELNSFIDKVVKNLQLRGNNPLFLGLGALKWIVPIAKGEEKECLTPFIIFPIRLVKSLPNSPIYIEFINDDIYINPCLIAKLRQLYSDELVNKIPLLLGMKGFDDPIDLEVLKDGEEYFKKVKECFDMLKGNSCDTVFDFNKDIATIGAYDHNDLCMYYDVKNNRKLINESDLVNRIYNKQSAQIEVNEIRNPFLNILESDSVQENIITKAINGESMVIKGPPGTGKTLTIANMVANLLNSNKTILVSSKKLAALSEVYNKLPYELRRYVLLLDSESEIEASKISPKSIKKDLKEGLDYIRHYKYDENNSADLKSLNREKQEARKVLSDYYKNMFGSNNNDAHIIVLGKKFYDALDEYLSLDKVPLISHNVIDKEYFDKIDREIFNKIDSIIGETEKSYLKLTDNKNINLEECPYVGINKDCDKLELTMLIQKCKEKSKEISSKVKTLEEKYNTINKVNLLDLDSICNLRLDQEQIGCIYKLEKFNHERLDELIKVCKNYQEDDYLNFYSQEIVDKGYVLDLLVMDPSLKISEISSIIDNVKLFAGDNDKLLNKDTCQTLLKLFEKIDELKEDKKEYLFKANEIYKKDLTDEQVKDIIEAYEAFKPYLNVEEPKLGLFAFKAKSYEAKLRTYSYLNNITLKDIISATEQYYLAFNTDKEVEAELELINRAMHGVLTNSELEAIKIIVRKTNGKDSDIKEYVKEIEESYKVINEIYEALFNKEDVTVNEIVDKYFIACRFNELKREILKVIPSLNKQYYRGAKQAIALYNFIKDTGCSYEELEEYINSIYKLEIEEDVIELHNNFINIKENYGLNYKELCNEDYFRNKDIIKFADHLEDKTIIDEALAFNNLIESKGKLLYIKELIEEYEKTDKKSSLLDVFNKKIYSDAIEKAITDNINDNRFDYGKLSLKSIDKITEVNNKVKELNVKVIEHNIISRIDPNDQDFSFLMKENDDSSIRRIFKINGKGILKLKKCIIASPSTISLLFKDELYSSFDVSIVDEASQLEPVSLLPVAFRTKQLILVGDEWQMPPIDHFKAKFENKITNYDFDLEPDNSALSLALTNESFKTYFLECHYRSKTESLIKFSQERFYESMHTFPAQLPKKEDLGFNDIFVEDARCDNGVNELEALKVLEILNKHFDKYYKDGKLNEPIGVVAFGEKQRDKILSLVNKDKELQSKIDLCLMHKDEELSDDKVIFFKTIEEVQGQETNHLILSLTYGRDKNGKIVNRFGELNRDKLGQCIFNVAVTRAKYSITVIHSIKPEEIDSSNSRIDYIKDYLKISEFFSLDGKEQFITDNKINNFTKNIGEYLNTIGIEKERIVYNYGVTNGSIKIPLAVLNKKLNKAMCGLWIELPVNNKYNYLDYSINYYNILTNLNGWNLLRINIYDYFINNEYEKQRISTFINNIIEKEK